MKDCDDQYVHFQDCLDTLHRAWRIVSELEATEPQGLVFSAAFRMAIVEYAKPFKNSFGSSGQRLRIDFPAELSHADRELHDKLLGIRDQVLAHSDLSIKDAKVFLGSLCGGTMPLIIQNTEVAMPRLSEIRSLLERVLDSLSSGIAENTQRLKNSAGQNRNA